MQSQLNIRDVYAFMFDWTGKNFAAVCVNQTGGAFLYSFADFNSVKALPDVVTATELAEAIGMSVSRTHEILDEKRVPYLKLERRKIIFKEHLLQGLSGKRIFTDVAELCVIKTLPNVFSPKRLITALRISNGTVYILVRTPGFPAVFERNRIVVSKAGFIEWIRKNECNKN